MVTRRQGREWALQLLVQFDLNPPTVVETAISAFWEQQMQIEVEAIAEGGRVKAVFTSDKAADVSSLADARAFAEARVLGVWENRDALDSKIEEFLRNWSLYRLGSVERNALRIGAWELLHCDDIPGPIIVNEAIDLAKFFSETKSGKFVNGVMDNMAKTLRKPKSETFVPGEGK